MSQQQANEELHQMTVQALFHALLQQATEDEIRLLCFHAGVQFKEIEQCQKSMK
jgi:thiamine biosynthesis protein ThiC